MSESQDAFVAPNCNIELKARIADMASAQRTAETLATSRLSDLHQVDTYFHCRHGRLKLREFEGNQAELIWYQCANQNTAKASNYAILPVEQPNLVKQALAAALGIRVVVEKHRQVYLFNNVRIHLDRVVDLGTFLEFEAVLGPDISTETGNEQIRVLSEQFQIDASDLIDCSYGELVGGQLSND